jgi:hypothetical protein
VTELRETRSTIRVVRRLVAAGGLLVASVSIWLTLFFGSAYAIVWLVETYEGPTSECWSSECGKFGEFLDDHDLATVASLAVLAALPAVAVLWRGRWRFIHRDARSS